MFTNDIGLPSSTQTANVHYSQNQLQLRESRYQYVHDKLNIHFFTADILSLYDVYLRK